jgi:hypothetical protein
MNLVKYKGANVIFKFLMDHHNLTKDGWNIHFCEMSTYSAKTDFHIKRIKLSKYYIISSSVTSTDIINTILNEVSKALTSGKCSTIGDFNKTWKKKCVDIGGTPRPVCDPFVDKEYYKFHLTCKDGCFSGRMRMTKKDLEKDSFECVKHGNPLKSEKNKNVKLLEF